MWFLTILFQNHGHYFSAITACVLRRLSTRFWNLSADISLCSAIGISVRLGAVCSNWYQRCLMWLKTGYFAVLFRSSTQNLEILFLWFLLRGSNWVYTYFWHYSVWHSNYWHCRCSAIAEVGTAIQCVMALSVCLCMCVLLQSNWPFGKASRLIIVNYSVKLRILLRGNRVSGRS